MHIDSQSNPLEVGDTVAVLFTVVSVSDEQLASYVSLHTIATPFALVDPPETFYPDIALSGRLTTRLDALLDALLKGKVGVLALASPSPAPTALQFPLPARFPVVTANPVVQDVLNYLGPLIASEVNLPALERLAIDQLVFHPMTNPVPVVLANAETLFPEPTGRSLIVKLLGYIAPRHDPMLRISPIPPDAQIAPPKPIIP